jgi:endonuclease/exonuclease/phosphatase family metal-dependent hydrolase
VICAKRRAGRLGPEENQDGAAAFGQIDLKAAETIQKKRLVHTPTECGGGRACWIHMRIASYNVRYFSHGIRGLAPTRRSLSRIAEALAVVSPEILCLQEVRSESQLADFRRELGGRYQALHFPAHPRRMYPTGLAILIQGRQVKGREVLQLSDGRGERRICAHVDLDGLHVFNAHLSVPALGRRPGHAGAQLREAIRLREFVIERANGEPFLLCGDFNSSPSSPVARQFVADAPTTPSFGFGPLRLRLDYLFGGNGVTWLDGEESHRFGDRRGRFHGLSDHVPQIARFECAGTVAVDPPAAQTVFCAAPVAS